VAPVKAKQSLRDVHPRDLKGIVKEIPTLPVIYQQLFAMMEDPNASIPELAELISKDQALTAKTLCLVNSALYGNKKQINTISRAVVILGFQAVRRAALATSVFDYLKGEKFSDKRTLEQFWAHSIAVGSICKVLAPNFGIQQDEEAFVAGLLHDIGKLVLKKYFPADFDELGQYLAENPTTWSQAEKQLFGFDHATIGKTVFRAWRFPPSVVEAVHLHHAPSSGASFPQLVTLVHLADYIAYQLDLGSPLGEAPDGWDEEALASFGIDEDTALAEQEVLENAVASAMDILQLTQ